MTMTLQERAVLANRVSAARRVERAKTLAETYRWFVQPLVEQGLTLADITRTINAYPIKLPSGESGQWSKTMVKRVLKRLDLYDRVPGRRVAA